MKAIVCEICNSNDLVKQEGMFVCRYCGTKYSLPDAKKLFVEGSVKIDHTDEVQNLYILARRYQNDNDHENAYKYYERLLAKQPSSWEATFYTQYYQSLKVDISQVQKVANRVVASEDTVIALIKENVTDPAEQEKAVREVAEKLVELSQLLFSEIKRYHKQISGLFESAYKEQLTTACNAAAEMLYRYGEHLIAFFGDTYGKTAIYCWKAAIEQQFTYAKKYADEELILAYLSKVKKYDPTYKIPETNSTGGCYVATSIYGSYDCPQVWILRRFRDATLAKTCYGRCFIRAYYAFSPTLVKWFGKTKWFKRLCTPLLERLVKSLRENGVEDTPYIDRP